ncbi:MAG TPA: XRE family transcriptional regulator [Candidatus Limnocylindrales bacterium]|nr:XRE family transcriptional regulator [Candidatus Limnocylindrales bacterium]
MQDDPRSNLGANLRRLRAMRGLSQEQAARLAGVPRATWASLESGGANPTLVVLTRVAAAVKVAIEELIGPPRTACRLYRAAEVPERRRQGARLRPLVPEAIAGLEVSRMELSPGAMVTGVPHTPGTREYLTCESGQVELSAGGERWKLTPGDVLVFRGDQKHGYRNPSTRSSAVAISVVCFARGA